MTSKQALHYTPHNPLKVLNLGPIRFAHRSWEELSTKYNVEILETSADNRDDFIKELISGKLQSANYIARTFESAQRTGLFDEFLLKLVKEHTQVKAISHCGAGYDQVDAIACGKLGIQLSNVPNVVDNATADTAVYLLLGAMRNFQLGAENMKKGLWKSNGKCGGTPYGHDPERKVLGILGMGGIGRTIRDRLLPYGFSKILYHNRKPLSSDLGKGAIYCKTKEELYKKADIICISIPLNEHTKHSVNADAFSQMKNGVTIVNTARGPIVNEADLKEALKNGKVGSFGSDVWENEPDVDMELISMPNVTVLPHMGTHTYETMQGMEEHVVQNIIHYYETGKVLSMVPELSHVEFD
ncbi:hypothetical protein CANINC_002993 [Pichia inconspicua]|uniref:Uncharacterized protein n=1 Tax=Pichia inconspicua TaxID=52247 RepID=A0A4T0X122_9ASCO|nr:hypothetical protein CANINC_002993 [[Candida] inconspicua]